MSENTISNKPFMTYEQQIDKLVIDKGLEINDREYAVKCLFHATKRIDRKQLYKYMGFPENWRNIRDCNRAKISKERS